MINYSNIQESVTQQLCLAQREPAETDDQLYGLTKDGRVVTSKMGSMVSKNDRDQMVSFFKFLNVGVGGRGVRQTDVEMFLIINDSSQPKARENHLNMVEANLFDVIRVGGEVRNQALVLPGNSLASWPTHLGGVLSKVSELLAEYNINLVQLMKKHSLGSNDSVVAVNLPDNPLGLKKLVVVPVDAGTSCTEELCRQYRQAGKTLGESDNGVADWHVVVLPPAISDQFDPRKCDGFGACVQEVKGLSAGQGVTIVCPPKSDVLPMLQAYGMENGCMLPKAGLAEEGKGDQASGGADEVKGLNQTDVVEQKRAESLEASSDEFREYILALQNNETQLSSFDLKQYLAGRMGFEKSTQSLDDAVNKILDNMYALLRRCEGGGERLKGKAECYKAIFNQIQEWLLEDERLDVDAQWRFYEEVKGVCPTILKLNDQAPEQRNDVNQDSLGRLLQVRDKIKCRYDWVPGIN